MSRSLLAPALFVLLACERAAPACPDDMVAIAAGTVQLGAASPGGAWELPAERRELSAYCIDRYEFPNRAGELPRASVTWPEARAACAAAGKRLCTAAEWARTCRGPEGRRFSYGQTRDPARCNTPITGAGPAGRGVPVAPSGAHAGCVSPEGVFDLNGNLSEWTATPWDGPVDPFSEAGAVDASWRELRGGTMWDQTFYGQDCLSRHGHDDAFQGDDDGFRCCRDPG